MDGLMSLSIGDWIRRVMAMHLEDDPNSEAGKRTIRARKILSEATLEARSLGHNYLGTEHLLLGILKEERSAAVRALSGQNVTLEQVSKYVNESVAPKRVAARQGKKWPLTRASQKAMRLSWNEAQKCGHNYIDSEHILLGLLDGSESSASRLLDQLGSDPNQIRREIVSSLDN